MPLSPQHLQQRDQRQADQGVRVPAFQPVEQCDPQSFTLKTACAVQRLLHANIGSDLRFAQRAKMHVERLAQGLQLLAAAVVQRQAGIKSHGLAAGLAQLCPGVLLGMGLAGDVAIDHADLIGADDQMLGIGEGQRLSLRRRQAQHQRFGGFTRQWGFIHLGCGAVEG